MTQTIPFVVSGKTNLPIEQDLTSYGNPERNSGRLAIEMASMENNTKRISTLTY